MLELACAVLWYVYMTLSVAAIVAAIYCKGQSTWASGVALVGLSAFHIAAVFRASGINSDTLSYQSYASTARTMDMLCFMIGTRFEPLNSSIMWLGANTTGDYRTYLMVMALLMVASCALIFALARERFLLFAALTFPQFAMTQSLATVRWGVALHLLAATMAALSRRGIALRSIGAVVATLFHFGVAVAAAATVVKQWWLRLLLAAVATALVAAFLPTSELTSGLGLRYIVALALSASLMLTVKASVTEDAGYRDHLTLVATSAIMSSLYFVSPHLTRFAVALLFVSYVPLIIQPTKLLDSRIAIATLALVPLLVLGIETRTSSCTVWAADRSDEMRTMQGAAAVQYEGLMAAQSAALSALGEPSQDGELECSEI